MISISRLMQCYIITNSQILVYTDNNVTQYSKLQSSIPSSHNNQLDLRIKEKVNEYILLFPCLSYCFICVFYL